MKYFLNMNLFGIHWSETLGTYEEDFRPTISNFKTLKNHLNFVLQCIFGRESHWNHDSVKLGYNSWVYDFNPHPRDSDTDVGSEHQPTCAEHSTISTHWVSTKDRTRHQRTRCLPSSPKAQIGDYLKGLSVLDSCLFKCTNHCHESQ